MPLVNAGQSGKQRPGERQASQDFGGFIAKGDHHRHTGFPPSIRNGPVGPVNVLAGEVGNIGLGAAQMPKQLIIGAGRWIALALLNLAMLLEGDGPFSLYSTAAIGASAEPATATSA